MTDFSVRHVTTLTLTIGKRAVPLTEEEARGLIAQLQEALGERALPITVNGSKPAPAFKPGAKFQPLTTDDKRFIRKAHSEGTPPDKIAGILGRPLTLIERELVDLPR